MLPAQGRAILRTMGGIRAHAHSKDGRLSCVTCMGAKLHLEEDVVFSCGYNGVCQL
jgi:hypothetical protein